MPKKVAWVSKLGKWAGAQAAPAVQPTLSWSSSLTHGQSYRSPRYDGIYSHRTAHYNRGPLHAANCPAANWSKRMIFNRKTKRLTALWPFIFIIGLINCSSAESQNSTGESVAVAATATVTAVPTQPATLPPAIVVELPSRTPIPATDTPIPTDTPTAVPITDTPTAVPPTNTAVLPTAPPQIGASGLVTSHFALQDRSSYTVNGAVWFEYNVSNSTGGNVPYNALGVMPKKDGQDRFDWYQQTYGGPNYTIKPGGLVWAAHIDLPETGNYTL